MKCSCGKSPCDECGRCECKATGWVDVKYGVPKAYETVLVLTLHNRHHVAHHHGEKIPEWEGSECQKLYGITHWMPLPEKPNE
jgi:hypothetical protein